MVLAKISILSGVLLPEGSESRDSFPVHDCPVVSVTHS
jgi:hypothetical protein